MERHRKLLIASPLVLVAIIMVFFIHQLTDSNPQQSQPVQAISGVERVGENQTSRLNIPLDDGDQEVPSAIEEQLTSEDSQEITIASDSITLSGWVATEFGQNIAGQTVVLYSSNLRTRHSIITGSSGEFIFSDLRPSYDYVLKVSPQGMFKRYTKFPLKLVSSQEVHNIVLESIPIGILTGRFVDPFGQAVSGIELFIKTVEIDSWSTNVITGVNGNFVVADFPKGKFEVAIRDQQLLRATGLKFDPDAGGTVDLTIDLGPYHLRGRIYDESGQTFDGARVFLNWELQKNGVRIRSTRQVSADASGEFRFTGLGPGDHELVVSAWRVDTFGQTLKKTVRQKVTLGVDPEELNIFIDTLKD